LKESRRSCSILEVIEEPGGLAHLDDAVVGVAQIAAELVALVVEGRGQELGAPSPPLVVDGLNVGDAQIEELS
jgi:hypothetical protein